MKRFLRPTVIGLFALLAACFVWLRPNSAESAPAAPDQASLPAAGQPAWRREPLRASVPPASGPAAAASLAAWPGARLLQQGETSVSPDGMLRRVQLLQPSDLPYRIRIEEVIQRAADGSETVRQRTEIVADHVLARIPPQTDRAKLRAQLATLGASLGQPIGRRGLHRITVHSSDLDAVPALLDALAQAPVDYAEPDYIVRLLTSPNDPRYLDGSLWGLHNTGQSSGTPDADIDAPEGWAIRQQAPDVVVAVIDTGIKLTHQDLAPNLWVNPNESADGVDSDGNGFIDDLHGINAIQLNGHPDDDQGHGTHVAGTIGARGDNGLGITGVAWNVRLMGLKFLSASGGGTTSDAIICIDYAVEHGAHILNNSWGGGGYSRALLEAVIAARDAGAIFVAAAGNSASDNDLAPLYPASLPVDNIVAVASTTRTDALSSFSCFGQGSVDIAAPGSDILSASYTNLSGYLTMSGTSMAAPHVSGALALLRAEFPTDSWGELINRLYRGGDSIPSLADGRIATGRRLNLHGALTTTTNRPLNDDFAHARVLHGDSVLLRAHNLGASAETGQPTIHGAPGANTLWFSFTSQTSGLTTVRVPASETLTNPINGQATTVNYPTIPAILEVFTGSAIDRLTSVASGAGQLSFTAAAGVTYHFAVAGQGGAEGLLMLEVVGPPRNSTLATALPLTVGISQSGTNRNAVAEPGEPAHGGQPATATIWYQWTANLTGRVAFTTRGSNFDTIAAVYSGPASAPTMSALVPVAANDNEVGRVTSRVEFKSVAATTYYFAVDGKAGATGNVALVLASPPTNDHFAEPAILAGTDVTRVISTAFASREAGEPTPYPGNGRGETLWFAWTAPQSGRTTIDLAGSFFPGLIGVYTGNAVEALTLVTRDGADNRFAQVTFDATQGTTYRILVDAWDWSLNNVPLRLRMVPTPANDNFAASAELQGLRASILGSNVGGTRETGEPSANSNGGGSVWYRWTAPATGTYGLYAERLNKPDQWIVVLNVFTGSAVNALTHVKEDVLNGIGRDAFARFEAVAGLTYHFQITGLTPNGIVGGVGPFRLDLRPIAEHAPENDSFAHALPLDGSSVFNFRTQNYGASAEPGEPRHSGYDAFRSLWWKLAVPSGQAGLYAVATSIGEGSVGTTIYRANNAAAPSLDALTQVASNVQYANQNFPDLRFQADEGQVYYIAVDNYEGALGRVIFNFQKVPANTTFANATVIPAAGLSEVTYNWGSVREAGEPSTGFNPGTAGHRSLWWRWTAPASGRVQVDTVGSRLAVHDDSLIGAQFGSPTILGLDTILGVYTGNAVNSLTAVGTNYRVSGYGNSNWSFQRNSRLEFNAVAGTTYHIMVNAHALGTNEAEREQNTHQGEIHFHFAPVTPPANDAFANATLITGTDYHTIVSNLGAAKESGEPNHGGLTGGRSLWWRWTAPESGSFVVSTAGNLYDDFNARRTGLGVYTGNAVNALTPVASNQNAAGPDTGDFTWSALTFSAVQGTTYYFGADSAFAGNLSFILTRPAPNDAFANATVMQGSRWTARAHNLMATKESGEPMIEAWANPPDVNFRSVWWRWTAPVSGQITVDTLGSEVFCVLGIFTGNSVNALAPVTQVPTNSGDYLNGEGPNRARNGTMRRTFNAVAGTTYHLVVQGAGFVVPSSGPITLSLVGPPAVPFAPTEFSATRVDPNRIELDWTDVAVDEEYYELERSAGNGSWTALAQLAPDATFYLDLVASAESDYAYRLRAVNSVGTSAWVDANASGPQVPAAPSGVTAQVLSLSEIRVQWTANAQANSYRLETSASGAFGPWQVLAAAIPGTTTSFLHPGLAGGSTRWYRLRAENALGAGPYSATVSASTPAVQTLVHDPFSDNGTSNGADELDVAWSITGNTFAVTTDSALDPIAPHRVAQLSIATTNKDEYLSFALPGEVSLAVGDTLRVSFKLRHTAPPRADASATGVSFAHVPGSTPWANAANRDYFFVTSFGQSGTLGSIRKNASGAQVLNSNASTATLASNLASVHAGTEVVTVTFEATRTAESAVRLRYQLGGGAAQEATDTNAPQTSFNRVFLRFRTRTDLAEPAFRIDDVTVTRTAAGTAPPEPAIYAWRRTHFGTAETTGAAADDADPDGDGLTNLLEYALDTAPTAVEANPLTTTVDGSARLQLTFRRARAELNYEILASSNLQEWNSVATNPGTAGETVTYTDTTPLTSTPRFLRLRVSH